MSDNPNNIPGQITVQPGDDLASLAEKFFGNQRALFDIVRANPGIIQFDSSGAPILTLSPNAVINLPDPSTVDPTGFVSQAEVDLVFGAVNNFIPGAGQEAAAQQATAQPVVNPLAVSPEVAQAARLSDTGIAGPPITEPADVAGVVGPLGDPLAPITEPADVAAIVGPSGTQPAATQEAETTTGPSAQQIQFLQEQFGISVEPGAAPGGVVGPGAQAQPGPGGAITTPADIASIVGPTGAGTQFGEGAITAPDAVAGIVGPIERQQFSAGVTARALNSENPVESAAVVLRAVELSAVTGDRTYMPLLMDVNVFAELGKLLGDVPPEVMLKKLGYVDSGDGTVWRLDAGAGGFAGGAAGGLVLYNGGLGYSAPTLGSRNKPFNPYGGGGSRFSYSSGSNRERIQRSFFGVRRAFG